MTELRDLLARTAELIADFRQTAPQRAVLPNVDLDPVRMALGELPSASTPADVVVRELASAIDPLLVSSAGPRYFGFVVGGAVDAATAADMLAVGWDQVAFNAVSSPAAAVVEEVAGAWLQDLLGIPSSASFGFVTGCQAANTVALAAARHQVLAGVGHDVEQDGLIGAPPVRVVATCERHATIDRALRLLGLGASVLEPVATDVNGAIVGDELARVLAAQPAGPTIVCLQAGNVNSGAFDDLSAAVAIARDHGAWVHVDGAFGLWAAASASTSHLVRGVELADSWATDGHKWLNVPYDCGYVFCAHPDAHAAALSYSAAYLTGQGKPGVRSPGEFVLESSRRARGFRHLCSAAPVGPKRHRRSGRPVLPVGATLRRSTVVHRRCHRGERCRAEPGPRAVR